VSAFAFASWVFCLLTSLLLFSTVRRWRYLLIKPSVFFLFCFHLFIQWPAAVFAGEIERFLSDPWSFGVMAQAFPLIGLAGSLCYGGRSARIVWQRLQHPAPVRRMLRRRAIRLLALCIVLVVAYYLSIVPFARTGLYAVFFDPSASAVARQTSLALLDAPLLQYSYSFVPTVFAPLMAVLLAAALGRSLLELRPIASLALLLALAGVLVASSLTGARSLAATIVLAVVLAWLLRKKLPFNPLYAGILGVVVLAVPVVLTIFREGRTPDVAMFGRYLQSLVLDRIFWAPLETGLWFAQYVQHHGLFGIAAIPKLAWLAGVPSINAPNLVGRAYTPWQYDFINANTSFVFAYYAYFGLASLPFSLLALWFLDVAVLAYRRIGDNLLVACVAAASVATMELLSIEYSTFWLSGGYGALLLVAFVVDLACRRRLRFGAVRLGRLRLGKGRITGAALGRPA
jgi:hypothetical protein